MAEKHLNTRIIHKHDTEANWLKAINFIPKKAELIIYDPDENCSYTRTKIGDGVTNVNDLAFMSTQSDWSQNDETELDYIKNRTHWLEPEYETLTTFELSDSTNEEGKEFYKNVPLSGGELYGPFIYIIDGVEYNISLWHDEDGACYCGDSVFGSEKLSYLDANLHPEDVPFFSEFIFDTIGVWGIVHINVYTKNVVNNIEIKQATGNNTYHTLDINYLPIDDIYNSIIDRMPIAEEATF